MLHRLSSRDVFPSQADPPHYPRAQSGGNLVHIGAGNFNRSHLAVYLDDLLRNGEDVRWAEIGVGIMPADEQLHAALRRQDFLYGVLERDTDAQRYRLIGSLAAHLYAPKQKAEVLAAISAPECRIVSMTVTEGGYFTDGARKFRSEDPALRADLANFASPATWLGIVAAAAETRMKTHGRPFTLLSCDNLQSNGETARRAILEFADLHSSELRRWMEANVSFPNSMVDRITPRTSAADRDEIAAQYGVLDEAPVVCEPFRQWVLEDSFIAGCPAWETVGVEMTANVEPYEKTKMRLLNGCHFAFAYPAAVAGLEFVAEAVVDVDILAMLHRYHASVSMTLNDLPGMKIAEYCSTVLHRFSNVNLRDQIARICSEGMAKAAKFIAPSIEDLSREGNSVAVLGFVIASWLRYLDGRDDAGRTLTIEDSLNPTADTTVALTAVLGDGANDHPAAGIARAWLERMRHGGMRSALRHFNATTGGLPQ